MSAIQTLRLAAACECASWSTEELEEYVGGLSNPSKMPGYSYGLPAADCQVGARLRNIQGSTCHSCYAHKGFYRYPVVRAAYRRRADSLEREYWVEAMAELITRRCARVAFFRWHDSGDLQSVNHLRRICDVAQLTPDVSHWLPTREYRIVTDYVSAGGAIPANLCVRLSAHMIGGHVPAFPRLAGLVTVSTVSANGEFPGSHHCPSRHQGNACGDCRACWSPDVSHVDYHLH